MFFDSVKKWIDAGMPFNSFVLGDCNEAMAAMPDRFVELSIVDPPYGIGADKKHEKKKLQTHKSKTLSNGYAHNNWDNVIPDEKYFKELKRVSKNQIIFGANYFGLMGGYLYWDKCVTMPTYSDGELAYCSLINSVKSFKYAWHGMIQENMKNKEIRIHPTQKPIALYRWLLQKYAKPGDKIIDTHVGSASSLIAFEMEGFYDYVGFELDKDYYRDSKNRLEQWRKNRHPELFEVSEYRQAVNY